MSTPYSKTLHILRNPHGFSEELVRQARYDAADTIERLERELACVHGKPECICNAGFGMNLSCPLHGVDAPGKGAAR